MKKIIKKLINKFGYDINKQNSKKLNFDDIYKMFFNDNIIIFDIGANKGQSIERFKKIFPNSIIHAFEPIKKEFNFLCNKYKNQKNIYLNNTALGDDNYKKEINLAKRSGVSSFNEFNKNHEWIKVRSKEYNSNVENFLTGKELCDVITLEKYCNEQSIDNIDILKIDTQGYEDKVLYGAKNLLLNNNISCVELEIIFDDTYHRNLSFTDIEKYLIPNFRFSGIKNYNQNLFEGINFFAEVLYIHEKLKKKK